MNLNKENKININKILENKKQSFIITLMLSHLKEKRKLEAIRYNKRIKSLINIKLINYKLLYKGNIIIYESKVKGKEYNYKNSELVFEGEFYNGKRKGGKEYKNGKLIF